MTISKPEGRLELENPLIPEAQVADRCVSRPDPASDNGARTERAD